MPQQLSLFGEDLYDGFESYADMHDEELGLESSFYFALQDFEEMLLKYGAESILKEISEDAFYELKDAFDALGER